LKLHPDSLPALNTVTAYGDDYVEINQVRHAHSVIVMPEPAVAPWPVASFAALAPEHFDMLLELQPELVVFGSGKRLRFPHPRLPRCPSGASVSRPWTCRPPAAPITC
jgi:uncharacterized protein